jgi:glycosyltransferase involved in cell wall biosynthesis
MPEKITHIISGLDTGGAEVALFKLLSLMDTALFSNDVISLTDIGPIGKKIIQLGIPVRALQMPRGTFNPLKVLQMVHWLRRDPPDIIQTWMYHSDLIGGIAGSICRIPVVWNIRQSGLDPLYDKRAKIWAAKLCIRLSPWLPASIVCCSESARELHTGYGYAAEKTVVIPNGFDLDLFHPDSGARLSVHRELGIGEDDLLIGLVGRLDPQKDHTSFIRAAGMLHTDFPAVHFLLCGDQITGDNRKLTGEIAEAGIGGVCHLVGRRDDMPTLYAAMDINTSSSNGEGFSNVIGEAMACGVPCVVTDVGDSALIVGDTGRVVPPSNPQALAAAWQELIEIGAEARSALGFEARRRIERHYPLSSIVSRYQKLYQEVAACAG